MRCVQNIDASTSLDSKISAEGSMTSVVTFIVFTECASSLLIQTGCSCQERHRLVNNVIIRPEQIPSKRDGEVQREMEKQWATEIRKEETTTNTKNNIEAFPGFASIHRIHQPQSFINSLFPAGTKQQNKSRLIWIGKIGGGRLSSSSRQSNWKRPNDVHFV